MARPALFAGVVMLVACGQAPPRAPSAPDGHGWFCFAPQERKERVIHPANEPRDGLCTVHRPEGQICEDDPGSFHAGLRSSCTRSLDDCERSREDSAKRWPELALDPCTARTQAWCFRYWSVLRKDTAHFF